MDKKNNTNNTKGKNKSKTLLGFLMAKEEPDKDYFPDLRTQWKSMDNKNRLIFILGGILGLLIFAGLLTLAYVALTALR